MILSSSLVKLNFSCLFSLHTSEACPSRTCPATAPRLTSCLPQNFIRFELNLWKKKQSEPVHLKNIQTCFLLHSKIHILSVDVWKDRHGGKETFSYWLSGHNATQLVQTTDRGKGGGGESKITQKIKSCLWKIWSTSQNTQTFPRSTFLRYAVISYGWPFLSLSVRLLSALSAQLSKAPQPPDLTSLLHSLA